MRVEVLDCGAGVASVVVALCNEAVTCGLAAPVSGRRFEEVIPLDESPRVDAFIQNSLLRAPVRCCVASHY